jgi:integrase
MNHMASIQKKGPNKYRFIAELGYDAKGKRKQQIKTITVDDPALLRAPVRLEKYLDLELKKFQMDVDSGSYLRPERMTFEVLIEKWTTSFVNKHLEEKTKESYLYQVNARILPYFRLKHADEITQSHINDYLDFLHFPAARLDGKDKLLGSASIVYAD